MLTFLSLKNLKSKSKLQTNQDMASSSSVSYNDADNGAAPQSMGHSIYDDASSNSSAAAVLQSGPAAVASFLANQFGKK